MSMHSRAFLLLRRDLIDLERFPLVGIAAQPQKDDFLSWSAKIEGLGGTSWEGGVFQIRIFFTEEFNHKPPEVHFMTIPFHPNVDPEDGSPSLLHWDEESTVISLLLSLQALLSNPELDEGCIRNPVAAKLLMEAPLTYNQMALDCVTASLRVDAGFPPYDSDSGAVTPLDNPSADMAQVSRERNIQLKPVSFDDYYTLWRGIATSIHGYKEPNHFLDLLDTDVYLNQVHCKNGDIKTGLQHKSPIETAPLEQRVNQHLLLKYGKSYAKRKTPMQIKSRAQRIEQLKQMYRRGMDTDAGVHGPSRARAREDEGGRESGEGGRESGEEGEELDQLLQWTQNLDEQILTTPNSVLSSS